MDEQLKSHYLTLSMNFSRFSLKSDAIYHDSQPGTRQTNHYVVLNQKTRTNINTVIKGYVVYELQPVNFVSKSS